MLHPTVPDLHGNCASDSRGYLAKGPATSMIVSTHGSQNRVLRPGLRIRMASGITPWNNCFDTAGCCVSAMNLHVSMGGRRTPYVGPVRRP